MDYSIFILQNSPVNVQRYFYPKSTATFASGGQKPFREKVSGLPKAFHWDGLETLFSFVPFASFVVYIF
jgi:hypothetical protein